MALLNNTTLPGFGTPVVNQANKTALTGTLAKTLVANQAARKTGVPVAAPVTTNQSPAQFSAATNVPSPYQPSNTASQKAVMQASVATPFNSDDVTNNDYGSTTENLYKANAPIDLNATGINSDLSELGDINNRIANTQSEKAQYGVDEYGNGLELPGAGGFVNDNIDYNSQRADVALGNLGNAATGINNTLAQQLAVAQAQRTAGVQQATVPFTAATPVSVSPGTALENPYTGATVAGGLGGNSGSGDDTVNSFAQKVASGAMSYDDAKSALSQYGTAGESALLNAVTAINPQFNVNQSNANAANQATTLATSGTIQKNAASAFSAMDTLMQNANALSPLQQTPVGAVNSAANAASDVTGLGKENTLKYNQSLTDTRNQIIAVLEGTGMTPTDAGSSANSLLPDGLAPSQLAPVLAQAKQLINQRISAFSNPSNIPNFNNGSSNGSSGSFSAAAWN